MTDSRPSPAVSRLCLLAFSVALASCSSPPPADPPELTPPSSGDIDLMLARFAKSVHVIADLNENGQVTYQELLRVDADADDEKFRTFDLDGSGGLSLEETTTAVTKGEAGTKLRRRFDPNNDGVIEAAEQAEFDDIMSATEGLRKFVEVEHLFSL